MQSSARTNFPLNLLKLITALTIKEVIKPYFSYKAIKNIFVIFITNVQDVFLFQLTRTMGATYIFGVWTEDKWELTCALQATTFLLRSAKGSH